MTVKTLFCGILFLIPSFVWALVGDQTVETTQVACSISVCKLKDANQLVPIYTHQIDYEKCMDVESNEVTWLREEQIGESEDHVRFIFETIYGTNVTHSEKNFSTLAKLNWSCGEDRNNKTSLKHNTARPLYELNGDLAHVNENFRWESHRFDKSTGVHTFTGLGWNDGFNKGRLSYHKIENPGKTHLLCRFLGFAELVSIEPENLNGDIFYVHSDFSTSATDATEKGVKSVQCRGVYTESESN